MKLMLNGKEVSGMGHYVMAGDIKDATAEDSNVLSGKAFYNNNGKREGTMPNRGGMSAELTAGGSVSILEGYHNGEGVVRAQDLASQTPGTMTAETLSVGETGWANGKQITGSLVVPLVNDWDPTEMEENVMLDLTGYTYLGIVSNSEKTVPGSTIIFTVSKGEDSIVTTYDGNTIFCPTADLVGQWFKIVLPSAGKKIKNSNLSANIIVWYK